jgi:hypothetical protein
VAFRSHDRTKVPGLDVVEARVAAVSPDLSIEKIGYDFDGGVYRLRLLARNERQADIDFDGDRPSLADLVGRVTDFNGVGEISQTGSISWSDSTQFKQLAGTVGYPGS